MSASQQNDMRVVGCSYRRFFSESPVTCQGLEHPQHECKAEEHFVNPKFEGTSGPSQPGAKSINEPSQGRS